MRKKLSSTEYIPAVIFLACLDFLQKALFFKEALYEALVCRVNEIAVEAVYEDDGEAHMNKAVFLMLLLLLFAGCASVQPGLNEPVSLRLGETRQVGPDGFEIALRSVSDDSGCVSAQNCSAKLFHGSFGVRLGEKSTIMQVSAGLKEGNGVLLDVDGYKFYLTDFQRYSPHNVEATILVIGRTPEGTISK